MTDVLTALLVVLLCCLAGLGIAWALDGIFVHMASLFGSFA